MGEHEGTDLGHGRRLSTREYEKRIVALHQSARGDEQVRRGELDLAIDHRLGCSFPKERREALWRIQQGVEKRRMRLVGDWALNLILPRWLERRANKLGGYVVNQYAKVLNPVELDAFFGAENDASEPW
jgi:hypothetical protein